jgi:hypothetical protein
MRGRTVTGGVKIIAKQPAARGPCRAVEVARLRNVVVVLSVAIGVRRVMLSARACGT